MICAAVKGVMTIKIMPETTRYSHASSGMRNIVMPLHRMQMVVAMMLTAAPTVPNPETISDNAQ